nr:hypothetical protein [uncultured Mediterranean phage uvMED]
MSNDKLDKNGKWTGTQEEYLEFAKDIINDINGNEGLITFEETIMSKLVAALPQEKLEDIISEYASELDHQMGEMNSGLTQIGLLIKINPVNKSDVIKVDFKV